MLKLKNLPSLLLPVLMWACSHDTGLHMDLSGEWKFQVDSLDQGIDDRWYDRELEGKVTLPGSMADNGKGKEISVNTEWTGDIIDKSWFTDEKYARYRVKGNVKVPFWLQPDKHYIGVAWYQKEIEIPAGWKDKYIELLLERPHWETQIWVDDHKAGMQNTLGSEHVYDLTNYLKPGTNLISIRVDNRIKEVNPGVNSHSISDHTQSNWNGIAGKMVLYAKPPVFIKSIRIYPDADNKEVKVRIMFRNI